MNTTTAKPSNPTTHAGRSTPHPPETHQRAGGFLIEGMKEGDYAARLLVNPGKGCRIHKDSGGFVITDPSGFSSLIPERWVRAHHDGAARALVACASIERGNNGYADIGTDPDVADAVAAAGFTVIHTTNLHGLPVFRGFTARGLAAFRADSVAVSTHGAVIDALDDRDFERLILAEQEHLTREF